jgi:signal transduction histidine kinase
MMPVPLWKKLLQTYALAWVVLILGLCVTAAVGWSLFRQVRELDQNRFDRQVRQTTETIRDRIEKYQLAVTSLAGFASLRPQFTPAEWNFRVRLLQPEKNYPGLLELGMAEANTNTSPPQTPGLAVDDLDKIGEAGSHLRLLHVWVCPPSAYDGVNPRFLTDSAIGDAVRSALQADAPSYCYRRELASEVAGKPAHGFTIFAPFRAAAEQAPGSTPPASDRPLPPSPTAGTQEFVFGSIEPNLLLASLFGTAPREVGFDLFSGEPLAGKTCLNAGGSSPPSLLPRFKPYLQARVPVRFQTQEWILVLYTTALFERESSRYRPWTALATGTALSALIAALLFVQVRARLRVEGVAGELRSACEDLQQVQNERERIGRDLHDGAIQSLYGFQLALGQLERAQVRNPEAARDILRECRSSLDALIAELRTFIVQHLPGEEDPNRVADASAALQQLVHRFQSAARVPIELVLKDSPPTPLTLAQQMHLRQIAQEAISNGLRHSRARYIQVALLRQERHLQLRVTDDGAGFDTAQSHSGFGLANMQGRAVQLGGALRIESQPGQGTTVTLEIPLKPETSAPHV